MSTPAASGLGAAAVAVLDVAATIEAIRTDRPVLAVLTGIAAAVAVLVLWQARRRALTVRSDLAAWYSAVAAATGERPERVVDRVLADHRAAEEGTRHGG